MPAVNEAAPFRKGVGVQIVGVSAPEIGVSPKADPCGTEPGPVNAS